MKQTIRRLAVLSTLTLCVGCDYDDYEDYEDYEALEEEFEELEERDGDADDLACVRCDKAEAEKTAQSTKNWVQSSEQAAKDGAIAAAKSDACGKAAVTLTCPDPVNCKLAGLGPNGSCEIEGTPQCSTGTAATDYLEWRQHCAQVMEPALCTPQLAQTYDWWAECTVDVKNSRWQWCETKKKCESGSDETDTGETGDEVDVETEG